VSEEEDASGVSEEKEEPPIRVEEVEEPPPTSPLSGGWMGWTGRLGSARSWQLALGHARSAARARVPWRPLSSTARARA
jgi:hypothetical protein